MDSIGEKGFISDLLAMLNPAQELISGFGHDAAVIELPDAPFDLITKIDRASYPVAMKKGWSSCHRSWGRMAVTANCSDILSSGGTPISCMLAVIVPGSALASDVRDVVIGAADECRTNGVVFAGGDTKEASVGHVIGSAVGIIRKGGFLPRNTARPGDKIFCAGKIGGFAGAYFLLSNQVIGNEAAPADDYLRYLTHPVAQWDGARRVNQSGLARCGMDASDGLLDVLQTFATVGLGVEIELSRIPYHEFAMECSRITGIPIAQLIFGGGDWNILYVVPEVHADRFANLSRIGSPLTLIGSITESGEVCAVGDDGSRFAVDGPVNEHFRSRIEDGAGFMDSIETGTFLKCRQS